MTTAERDDLAHLRALLHTSVQTPDQHLRELVAARTAAAGQARLGRDVLLAEANWLLDRARGHPPLQAEAQRTAAALRGLRARCLAAAPADDVEALFDLAELRGECLAAGETDAATAIGSVLDERARQVTDRERLLQEADERWAAQTAFDSSQPLAAQIEVLQATSAMLAAVARATADRRLRRASRRCLRAARDRELAARLERLLGRSGVIALETASVALLFLVLALLVIEATFELTPAGLRTLYLVDGAACLCFIGEFGLKFALAPRRWSWFVRNAVTDLLPAVPAVLFMLPVPAVPGVGPEGIALRALRFVRVTLVARYVQALRPLLNMLRLVLLMVRGMDGLVRRFLPLLDRNFVFFDEPEAEPVAAGDRRDLVFAALERERTLLGILPLAGRHAQFAERLQAVAAVAATLPGSWSPRAQLALGRRDIAVEEASEFLWSLQPADVSRHLTAADLGAIDRVVRVLSRTPVGWLPFVRRFRVVPLPTLAEERVAAFAHRIADWLQGWQARLQFFADLHGIVTGPQILDRVATAMVTASQRPATRLLFFGGLFMLFDLLIQSPGISAFFQRIVVGPLLVLGSVCLVILTIGWWLKRVAGEASESFRRTSEAHFLSLLDLQKLHSERQDLAWLAVRVFAGLLPPVRAAGLLAAQLAAIRSAGPPAGGGAGSDDAVLERAAHRAALLYLHFLDGAILHESDDKTTEQLLANLSLENLRHGHLGLSRKDKKRLRQLRLDDGTVFRGPYLWFRFITESIAVETAKRITEYNRRCAPLAVRSRWPAEREQELRAWLARRCDPRAGRTLERLPPPDAGTVYQTTEFSAFEFLSLEPARDDHVRAMFGDDVLAALRADRRNMIREIFGMRPVHALPRSARSFNAWRFYWSRLSHGRALLLPFVGVLRFLRGVRWFVGRIRQIVREVLSPHLAMQQRQHGEAPFRVALRKIHRMKAPGLLEAIRLRLHVDPEFSGAPAGWSESALTAAGAVADLERDLGFLCLPERERAAFRNQAARNRELVGELHGLLATLPEVADPLLPAADGELAVTVAWLCDKDQVRTLLRAEQWRAEAFPALASRPRPESLLRRLGGRLMALLRAHPVDAFLRQHCGTVPARVRSGLRRVYRSDPDARAIVDAWQALPQGRGPAAVAIERLRAAYADGAAVRRDVLALRAVQSLTVLDVRNYRQLVFQLGGYALDGEDAGQANALP